MIEAVAKAIYEARNGPKCLPWAHQVKSHKAPYLADARAAIEAMREPTKEMIQAGNDKIDECIDFWNYDSGSGYSVEPQAAFSALNAMIDAALSETPHEQ